MAIALDNTHQIIAKLRSGGFSESQATAITEAIQEIDLEQLVTKQQLEIALAKQTTTLLKWYASLLIPQVALLVTLIGLLLR